MFYKKTETTQSDGVALVMSKEEAYKELMRLYYNKRYIFDPNIMKQNEKQIKELEDVIGITDLIK